MGGYNCSRRDFMKTAGLGAASMALASCATSPELRLSSAAGERPNIIFIMADDLGYGDLGCYGQRRIRTPNLDRMGAEGIRFTDCYTGSTVCAPSRSVLMTGQHTGHTRVRGNKAKVGGVSGERRVPLEPGDVTVAEVLKGAGYATGITGKWGLGEPGTTGVPNRQGFDEWLGYLNQAHAHSYFPDYIWRNEEKLELPGNSGGAKEEYTQDMFTEFALDFIRRNRDNPFFLYVPWCIPHAKLEIPSIEPYAGEAWPEDAKTYAAMVTRMDTDTGKILGLLEELGIDGKTVVFFCSDNGAARRWEKMFDSSGPLRGHKRDLYEGGIRTPMIVRWPGKIPAGATSGAVWYFADVMPTFAALAGVDAPGGIDGINVLPAILGGNEEYKDRFLYWEFFEGGYKRAARRRDWKVVRKAPDQPIELYDLALDIGEENNVAAENEEVVSRFEEYLKTARTPSPNWPVD